MLVGDNPDKSGFWRVAKAQLLLSQVFMFRKLAYLIAFVVVFSSHALVFGYREKGYQYLSPVPEAEYVSPQTKFVLVRFETVSPHDLSNLSTFINVTGDRSGRHWGQTNIATDDRTVIFEMSSNFWKNEIVTVTLTPRVGSRVHEVVEPIEYRFMVSRSAGSLSMQSANSGPIQTLSSPSPSTGMRTVAQDGISIFAAGGAMIMQNGVSVPSDFPHVDISINDNPAPGYIFIDYDSSIDYTMILDNTGAPVWYKRGSKGRDFKVQKNGMLTMVGGGGFIGYDQNFNQIASFRAVNGYSTDDHDLQVLADGGYLLIGRRDETVDMRQYVQGGKPNATVHATVLQEFTAAGELIFQWRAWDNFDIRQMENWSYDDPLTGQSIRFPHMNSVDIDTDGHIVLSSKRISEITKIDRGSGEIIWRLGGDKNQFTLVNDPLGGFNVQHDIHVVGENRYTLFDNHWLHRTNESRAVEYEIDANDMTATLVWQYQENPPCESYHMGNAQRLCNGNTLINWVEAALPKAAEVRPDGTKAFEMNWAQRDSKSYRVHRFPWQGIVERPCLVLESHSDNVTLILNKFGDSNVAYYCIYGGTAPHPTALLDTSVLTLKRLTDLVNGRRYYFRVTAVDIDGRESGYSNEENTVVHIVERTQNMVFNGDFSQDKASWTWEVGGSASAEWKIEDGLSHFDITSGGNQVSEIQLRQVGMQLTRGEEYVFEFDAWADRPRIIEAEVEQARSPWTNYSKIGFSYITPMKNRFRYSFIMEDPSDYDARVVFNMGDSNLDVYLDNVSLIKKEGP